MSTLPKQQPGLFDYGHRMKQLDHGPDPLARLNAWIDWTIVWQDLARAVEKETRGPGGRPHSLLWLPISTGPVLSCITNR
jgi:hypothetical protein